MKSKLPEKWEELELGEVIKIIGGGTPKRKEDAYWNGDISWISVKDFVDNQKYIHTTEEKITKEGLENSSTNILKEKDIIISARGTVGKLAVIKYPMAFNQSCYGLRAKESNVDNDFLYYFLKFDIERLKRRGHGSVFNTIIRSTLENLSIQLPPLKEQKAIANILSSTDDKIELNNKINKNLEAQAQAIFKHWFVDFEFPNENGNPYKSSGGEMIESELGMIPKGWKVKQLQEISEFQNGHAFYRTGYSDYGMRVVDLANVNILGEFVETDRDKFIAKEIYKQHKMDKFKLEKDDLVMIMTDRTHEMNILGKTGKILYSNKYILNQRVGRIRPLVECDVNFLRSTLNSNRILESLKSVALGSVQKYINTGHIKELKIVMPIPIIMKTYSGKINPIFEKMHKNNQENNLLVELRDTLLPKLMSGELRIPLD